MFHAKRNSEEIHHDRRMTHLIGRACVDATLRVNHEEHQCQGEVVASMRRPCKGMEFSFGYGVELSI